jgi:hypothetical protein
MPTHCFRTDQLAAQQAVPRDAEFDEGLNGSWQVQIKRIVVGRVSEDLRYASLVGTQRDPADEGAS